jgi:hypothetical protein
VVALAGWVSRRMFDTYSHPRIEAKNAAVKLLERTDEETGAVKPDFKHPAIQPEIARQVALELRRERDQNQIPVVQPYLAKGHV